MGTRDRTASTASRVDGRVQDVRARAQPSSSLPEGSGQAAPPDAQRVRAHRRHVGLVARQHEGLCVRSTRPRQQIPLLFFARTRTPRRRYDDQLRTEPAECRELVREAKVVARRQPDRDIAVGEGNELFARGNSVRLPRPEGVVQMDLPVRRLDARTGHEQRVVHSSVLRRLEQTGDDDDLEVRGHLAQPGRERTVERFRDRGQVGAETSLSGLRQYNQPRAIRGGSPHSFMASARLATGSGPAEI